MRRHLATQAGNSDLTVKQFRLLLIASAIAIILTGCGLPVERDVRAYDNCTSRHPQEAALCEGPRQAYDVDTSTPQARAVEGSNKSHPGSF